MVHMTVAVPLGPGDEAVVRMPSPAERAELGLDEAEPLIEIRRHDGTTELHGAHRARVSALTPRPREPHEAR
jgi:hypothetical protein